jgi:hypothetical protein
MLYAFHTRTQNHPFINTYKLVPDIKGTVSRDFLFHFFFMNQFPPQPQSIPLGLFHFFLKIWGDICSSRCTTSGVDTGGKWKFTVKFFLRSQQPDIVPIICHRVSLTPVANLPPVSTTLAKLVAKFAAGVVDTGGAP